MLLSPPKKEMKLLRIDSNDLVLGEKIGFGSTGEVFKAHYRQQVVAVKKLHVVALNRINAFTTEIKIMGDLNHPNIIRLLGITWSGSRGLSAVMEYMDKGDLRTMVSHVAEADAGLDAQWSHAKVGIAIDAACGLEYLHAQSPAFLQRVSHASVRLPTRCD